MATESIVQRQERITAELQSLLSGEYPTLDISAGTLLYELLLKPAAIIYAGQDETIETLRANMSLAQVLESSDPDPDLVDNLLSNYNVVRETGSPAQGILNVYVSASQNVHIPATAVFTCNSVDISPTKAYVGVPGSITQQDTNDIAYVQMRAVGDGTYVFSLDATTLQASETVLSPNQGCTSTLSNPIISRIETGSTFTGGSIEETTNELLVRAQTNINSQGCYGQGQYTSSTAKPR